MTRDADLTDVYAALLGIQSGMAAKRNANREWVKTHMPKVARLFDGLQSAGMSPKLVLLEKFA